MSFSGMSLSVLLTVQICFWIAQIPVWLYSGMLKDGKCLCFSVPERLLKLLELKGLFPVQHIQIRLWLLSSVLFMFSVARQGLTENCKSSL